MIIWDVFLKKNWKNGVEIFGLYLEHHFNDGLFFLMKTKFFSRSKKPPEADFVYSAALYIKTSVRGRTFFWALF